MGTNIRKLFERLKKEFIKVNTLQASLDTIAFFLGLNLLLFMFSINLVGGVSNVVSIGFLSVLLFFVDLYYRGKNFRLEIYEQKNPELREILRTGRDHQERDDIVSRSLFKDLLSRARKVASDSIIPTRQIIKKILFVGLLSFLVLLSGLTDFQIESTGFSVIPSYDSIQDIGDKEEEQFELLNSSRIFQEKVDIDASGIDLGVNITGSGKAGEDDSERRQVTPEEVVLDFTGSSLSEDYQLAKRYSLAIKNVTG
ncbi:MAG: hypothetical protein SVV03_00530 [Candidatus Nanohaloarchaea archaeon]|nr:hypothetical protein [Candidatus Nanohaloarchaea archaeon]